MFAYSIVIFTTWIIVKSAKILVVVPTPSISHQVVFRPLIQELINHHHEVVVIATDPAFPQGKSPKNLIEIDLHDLSYKVWQKVYEAVGRDDFLSVMEITFRVLHETFQEQLIDKSVQKLIRDKEVKFDLLILEECVTPTFIFSHIFKAPVIVMSSFGDNRNNRNVIGALTHPLLYPTQFHQRIYNLSTREKISELRNHIGFIRMFEHLETHDNTVLKSFFGMDTPALNKLKNNVQTLFLNVHPMWLDNQPVPLNLVYTWGIHKRPEKVLPEHLQTYLDSSKIGVIYVSFGTNFKTSSMDPKILEIFLKVFSQLPYNILLKWDMDELPEKSDNIKISKWFPQYDVLRHPNVKLFITQGGLQSTDEAITAGVPLIGIPLFSDQNYNTEKYMHFKIGIQLQFTSLTVEKFESAINTILNNDSYRKNIIDLRAQLHDQPKLALENAVWWVEYVLRHGGARHLRAPAANMTWTEYYELELVFVILSGVTILGTIILFSLYSCLRYVCCNKSVHIN